MEGSHTTFSFLNFIRSRKSFVPEAICTGETVLDHLVYELGRFRPSVVQIIDLILQLALEAEASDIHLDPHLSCLWFVCVSMDFCMTSILFQLLITNK